ncbi:MAG: hypothetical protein C0594_17260, partial [Marinilabiliales bacterium]
MTITNRIPVSLTGPDDAEVCEGAQPELSVSPSDGSGTYTYQWQISDTDCDGTWSNIDGATSQTYEPDPLSVGIFYYQVIVSDAEGICDSEISDCAIVTVVVDPSIDTESSNQSICEGGNADFAVTVSGGTGTFSYQWQRSTVGCTGPWTNVGTNSPNYNTGSMAIPDTYYYQVEVTQTGLYCDTFYSSCIELEVVPDPEIILQPAGETICSGTTWDMSVDVSGGVGEYTYTWFSSTTGGAPWTVESEQGPTTNTTSNYTTDALTASAHYYVEITQAGNGCNTMTSSTVEVVVPRITNEPDDDVICTAFGETTLDVALIEGDATI